MVNGHSVYRQQTGIPQVVQVMSTKAASGHIDGFLQRCSLPWRHRMRDIICSSSSSGGGGFESH